MRTLEDGNIGIKVPVYMHEVGLTEIECRLSDKVNLLLTHQNPAQQRRMFESLQAEGHGSTPQNPDQLKDQLRSRGLSADETQHQWEAEYALAARYAQYNSNQKVVYAPGMMITFGRVPASS